MRAGTHRPVTLGSFAVRRNVGVAGIAAAMVVSLVGMPAASASSASPAAAGDVVVVHGTELPLGLQLSFVGCDGLFDRGDEQLHPYVGIGPATPPLGERSLGYDLAGGDAVGSLAYVPAVGAASSTSLSVYAEDGTTGVAYVGYTSPAQRGTDLMWIGQAQLTVPAGRWSTLTTDDLTYTWTQVDVSDGQTVTDTDPTHAPPPATAHDFTVMQHGDGPGFTTLGFGCDGAPFDIDALHVGSSTYDFEGLDVSATIAASAEQVHPGDTVTLTGRLRDSSGALVPDGTLTLESRTGDGDWHTDRVLDASTTDPSVSVQPDATTEYRFTSPQRDLADAASSEPVTVTVSTASPTPTASPAPTSSSSPRPTRSKAPKPRPTKTSTPAPTSSPSPSATSSSAAPGPVESTASASPTDTGSPAAQ